MPNRKDALLATTIVCLYLAYLVALWLYCS